MAKVCGDPVLVRGRQVEVSNEDSHPFPPQDPFLRIHNKIGPTVDLEVGR